MGLIQSFPNGYGKLGWRVDYPEVEECSSKGRGKQVVVADFDGTLVRGRCSFPYFMLVAFEAGGLLKSLSVLLTSPLVWFLYHFVSEAAGLNLLIFVSISSLPVERIQCASRAVLPKFYCEDVHPESWRVFSSFGKRVVLTANPRIMVEAFAKEYLAADIVIGTEIEVTSGGRATGFVKTSGVLVGKNKVRALQNALGDLAPDVGLGDRTTDFPFMSVCKESYFVPAKKVAALEKEKLPKPLVFHDGRFMRLPTPLVALATFLWMPCGFLLAIIRIAVGALPFSMALPITRLLGVKVIVKGIPPTPVADGKLGVLFVCSHRSMLDPVMLSVALRRRVSCVTYSLSRLSEIISPITCVPLARDRDIDAEKIRKLLLVGDLVICPEGTTCREPFLLRFSSLFAELTDRIVPVAISIKMSMFHGTTVCGWKGMDAFFFLMNPRPVYEITFLNQLPTDLTCAGGRTSFEVANYVQRLLAATLHYECTNFTRKDKYYALARNDGTVPRTRPSSASSLICTFLPMRLATAFNHVH